MFSGNPVDASAVARGVPSCPVPGLLTRSKRALPEPKSVRHYRRAEKGSKLNPGVRP